MRKTIVALLALVILCWTVSASGPALSQPPLSEMTEAECIEFIQDSGVTIPQQFADDPTLGASIKDIIQQVEADPNVVIMYNYSVSHNFFNAVKAAVLEYHGISSTSASSRAVTAYVLQDNEVLYDEWSDNFPKYNCFSFALGITDDWWDLGEKCGVSYDWQDSIAEQADLARADIIEFGYPCVKVTPTRPTYNSLPSGAKAICIRQVDGATKYSEQDYHFMKLTSNGWHHKPGYTIPLKYLWTPSNSVAWKQEYVNKEGPAVTENKEYDSDIYYLIYSTSHYPGATVLTGNNYHSGVFHYYEYADECTHCGKLVNARWSSVSCDGPPCPILTSLSADKYIYIME